MTLSWIERGPDAAASCIGFRLRDLARFRLPSSREEGWCMALVKLAEGEDPIGRLHDLLAKRKEIAASLHLPTVYQAQLDRRLARRYATVFLRPAILGSLHPDSVLRTSIAAISKIGTFIPASRLDLEAAPNPKPQPIPVPDDAVIMAVIDSGIAFAGGPFRSGTASRVEQIWMMDVDAAVSGSNSLGRELERAAIDTLLAAHSHSGLLDDDAFYRAAGLIDHATPGFKPAALRRSHGTHVMSLAAGDVPSGQARPILCVQLPTIATADVSGTSLEPAINLALEHVLLQAGRFVRETAGGRPPLVVTLSYGDFAGPHDGTGGLEAAIDGIVQQETSAGLRTRVVLPAGNGNLARCHAMLVRRQNESEVVLNWRVQPDDRTVSAVEIRTPVKPPDRLAGLLAVSVTPPGGSESSAVGAVEGGRVDLDDDAGNKVGVLCFTIPAPRERGLITLCIAPTESLVSPVGLAPAGVWRIRVKWGDRFDIGDVAHAWIERDDTLPGFPRAGRQSYFEEAAYERFDGYGAPLATDPSGTTATTRRATTLSGFANGRRCEVVVAGAWNQGSDEVSLYSTAGPSLDRRVAVDPTRAGPDCLAVADDSLVLQGIFGAGSRSGSIVRMSGTSVAAPQVARLLADAIAAGQAGDRKWASDAAAADETDPSSGHHTATPSPERGGGGRLKRRRHLGTMRPRP